MTTMITNSLKITKTVYDSIKQNINRRNVATLAPLLHMVAVAAAAVVTDLRLLIPPVMDPVRVALLPSPSKRPTRLKLPKTPKLEQPLKQPSRHLPS